MEAPTTPLDAARGDLLLWVGYVRHDNGRCSTLTSMRRAPQARSMYRLSFLGILAIACGGQVGDLDAAAGQSGDNRPRQYGSDGSDSRSDDSRSDDSRSGGSGGGGPRGNGSRSSAGGSYDFASPGADATASDRSACVEKTYRTSESDCSGLPLPCSPCIACEPLAPGDVSGCSAPDIAIFDWGGGGVDPSLRYPTGCNVYLPTGNPYWDGLPQACFCDPFIADGSLPAWACPI